MKKIKFRAWIDNELLSHEQLIDMDQETHAMYTIITNEDNEDGVTFMQFTGLKDKNGREIYEGDIVRFIDDLTVVRQVDYKCEEACFIARSIVNSDYIEPEYLNDCDFEVLGNIHENPELMGE